MNDFESYIYVLQKLTVLQKRFISKIFGFTHLKDAKLGEWVFSPKYANVSDQLRNWPNNIPVFPLDTWVTPIHGEFEYADDLWRFSWSGQGVSFINSKNSQNVTVEFSTAGEICVTSWIVNYYLRSQKELENIWKYNEEFFIRAINQGVLIEGKMDKVGFQGPVYIFTPKTFSDDPLR